MGNNLGDTQFAKINADGTLGAWNSTSTFSFPRWGLCAVAHNGFLYALAGDDDTPRPYFNDVQYAPINSDGTLGTWQFTTPFAIYRYGHATVIHNDHIYVSGGWIGGDTTTDIQYASFNADGSVGTWVATTPLPLDLVHHAAAVYGDRLYVAGGMRVDATIVSNVFVAPINADGSLGVFTDAGQLPHPFLRHRFVVNGSFLYLIGGMDGSHTSMNEALVATFNIDGSLGPWQSTTTLPSPRDLHSVAFYNGSMYVLGGENGPVSAMPDVLRSSIASPPVTAAPGPAATSSSASSGGGGRCGASSSRCGLLGLEGLAILAVLSLLRRR